MTFKLYMTKSNFNILLLKLLVYSRHLIIKQFFYLLKCIKSILLRRHFLSPLFHETAIRWFTFLGLTELQCDNVQKLQNKLEHLRGLLNDPHIFKAIYRYSYDFARVSNTRSGDHSGRTPSD